MAGGTRWVEARLTILPGRWIALGLLLAAFTGIGAWLYGHPFLTSYFRYSDVPLVGKVPLASAVIFDLGVFTLVVGATVLILIALAHQSVRTHRAAPVELPTPGVAPAPQAAQRSEEHTSELQSLMRISYAVFCLQKKNT